METPSAPSPAPGKVVGSLPLRPSPESSGTTPKSAGSSKTWQTSHYWKVADAANFGWSLAFCFRNTLDKNWFLAGVFAVLAIVAAYVTHRRIKAEEELTQLRIEMAFWDGCHIGRKYRDG